MNRLSAFLHPVSLKEEREIVVSTRFVDEQGKPVPFKIRSLTQEESDAISRKARKSRKVGGQVQEYLDSTEFSRRLVVAATVEPDFSSTELCEAYGVMDPLLVPGKMLLSGEFTRLLKAITDLSGFDADEDLGEEAKN